MADSSITSALGSLGSYGKPFIPLAQDVEQAGQQKQGALQAQQQSVEQARPQLEAAEQGLSKAMQDSPTLNLPEIPQRKVQEMSGGTAFALIAAALLAGRVSRAPLLAASQAIGAATKAYRQGQQDSFDAAMKDYDRHVKAAEEQYKADRQKFEDAVSSAQNRVESLNRNLDLLMKEQDIRIKGADALTQTAQDKMGLLQESLKQRYQAIRQGMEHQRLLLEQQRLLLEQQRVKQQTDASKARADAALITAQRKERESVAKFEGVPQQHLASLFGMQKAPVIEPKQAQVVADRVETWRELDRADRSISADPGIATGLANLIANAKGNLDSVAAQVNAMAADNPRDIATKIAAKSLLDVTRAGALKLAGERGLTVGAERIARAQLTEGNTSPYGFLGMIKLLKQDTATAIPGELAGQKLELGRIERLPTYQDIANDVYTSAQRDFGSPAVSGLYADQPGYVPPQPAAPASGNYITKATAEAYDKVHGAGAAARLGVEIR